MATIDAETFARKLAKRSMRKRNAARRYKCTACGQRFTNAERAATCVPYGTPMPDDTLAHRPTTRAERARRTAFRGRVALLRAEDFVADVDAEELAE